MSQQPSERAEPAGAEPVRSYRDPRWRALSELAQRLADPGLPPTRRMFGALSSIPALTAALRTLRSLERIDVELASSATQPSPVRRALHRRRALIPTGRIAVALLDVPEDPAAYSRGRSRQALRTNARKATERGEVTRRLGDREAQVAATAEILEARDFAPGTGAAEARRILAEVDLVLAAFDAEGRALAVAAVQTDGAWAHLPFFLTATADERSSDSRYLLSRALVETLSARRVRHLFVDSAITLPSGWAYMQDRLGFRPVNLRLGRRRGGVIERLGSPSLGRA